MIRSANGQRDANRPGLAGVQPDGGGVLRLPCARLRRPEARLGGVGVVRELLTIPMIVAVAAVFILATVRLLRNRARVNAVNVGSTAMLFALDCLVWI